MIYCIMLTGKPLSKAISNVLLEKAKNMYRNEIDYSKIVNDDGHGSLTTEFQTCCLGDLNGVAFHADLVVPKGKTKVEFLVRLNDLNQIDDFENVKWIRLRKKRK